MTLTRWIMRLRLRQLKRFERDAVRVAEGADIGTLAGQYARNYALRITLQRLELERRLHHDSLR